MYLKSIEIQGFKSFAKKITLEFPNGITGIVGPNGSGKSNIADAVRWVLGEQKVKQLRSSKMEDVIFAGTETRKPISYAFVAITLDNSDRKLKPDFEEITVARRVYRSGESEYLINGSPCRLKDVQELFYDTGIGKEGYSIIGQGQIDKILQGKPEERRELFDEAAGIVKYKKRKTIALRKLENERLNIARVGDILGELERQVGPLKRQSEAAHRFVELKEELKRYDINLFLIENGSQKEKIKDYAAKEKIASEELAQARIVFERMKEEYEQLSEDLQGLDETIGETQNRIAQCSVLKENMQGQANVLREQIKAINDAMANSAERIKGIESDLEEANKEYSGLKDEKKSNQEEITILAKQVMDKENELLDVRNKAEDLRLQIEEKKEYLITLINRRGELKGRLERIGALTEQMERRKAELSESIEKYASDKDALDSQVKELEGELSDARAEADQKKKQIADMEAQIINLDKETSTIRRERDLDKERLIRTNSQLENIVNITERYEGYGSAIKEVMKLKERLPGIHGVVADIIKVDKKYEVAIETALGGSIQNVVTDTEATAKEAINYLKVNKAGRATFLPLKAVSGRGQFDNEDVLSQKGVIGVASSLVSVEEKYKGIANYLLGRMIVCDTIDNALVLARKFNYSLIIVTLEGELLNRGGSLSGGAFKNKSNLLGRRREIDDLKAAIIRLEEQIHNHEKELKLIEADKEALSKDLTELKLQSQEDAIVLNTIELNLKQTLDKANALKAGFEDINTESRNIDLQTGSMATESDTLNNEITANEEEHEAVKLSITEIEKEGETVKTEEEAANARVQELKIKRSTLNERDAQLTTSIIKAENNIRRLENDLTVLTRSGSGSADQIKAKEAEIVSINEAMEKADAELASLNEELNALEERKETQAGAHKDFISGREEYAEKVANLDKEVFRLSQAREKLEESFEAKSGYIWEEYELTYNSALELRDESLTNVKEMSEHITSLKSSIRGLGTINVGAIEEYKEVKERYEFLSTQHADLLKAEADLVKIIKDLDREMRRQFNTEFRRIKEEFAKVFKEMFGGGTGSIELEEDVDVLDAGISIIAQPPGKKLA
ncbi:MAG: chromosome segregation protein SMC, partial [Parasporobacterium sp.]|nr:chromosome segregation protein SMC [Parasporobacterium sp.]